MKPVILLAATLVFSPAVHAIGDCTDVVKSFLSSSEYNSAEAKLKIEKACEKADPECVREVGDNLASSERADMGKFLPLVESCTGNKSGECYKSVVEKTPSFDRAQASQAKELLKQCQ